MTEVSEVSEVVCHKGVETALLQFANDVRVSCRHVFLRLGPGFVPQARQVRLAVTSGSQSASGQGGESCAFGTSQICGVLIPASRQKGRSRPDIPFL
ncbi:hypothetical protein GCM10010345_18880 [Streptomyces canarius]|uniref:Uncharacterized protein n=1 Tax=Streptomyces canarius TaxID=285453 RepID=A0ABQ3CIB6_9ACTN|nr:hypothetical protein GCM10010345_18880 [Streptomyces canarius]